MTARDAFDEWMANDEWQFADREACWKFMFEKGQESMRQQLAAAIAACQLKDSALENITVVPPGLVTTSHDMRRIAQSALASQLDNQALEEFAAKVRKQCADLCYARSKRLKDGYWTDDEWDTICGANKLAGDAILEINDLP